VQMLSYSVASSRELTQTVTVMPWVLRWLQSIPLGVNLTTDMSTHDAFVTLINNAQITLDIAAFYFSLTDGALPRTVLGIHQLRFGTSATIRLCLLRPHLPCRLEFTRRRVWYCSVQCNFGSC
jgi:uncharacterized membrane protein